MISFSVWKKPNKRKTYTQQFYFLYVQVQRRSNDKCYLSCTTREGEISPRVWGSLFMFLSAKGSLVVLIGKMYGKFESGILINP